MKLFNKIRNWFRRWTFYVIADANDNSITFSRALCSHIDVTALDVAKVMVCRVGKDYCFMVNPDIDRDTQLADIQYNTRYRCVGFETLVPTVNRIFYDYGMPAGTRAKLSVEPRRTATGRTFYHICRPYEKPTR
mgnify:CR=1 FL=1